MKFKFLKIENKITAFIEDWKQLGPEGETLWVELPYYIVAKEKYYEVRHDGLSIHPVFMGSLKNSKQYIKSCTLNYKVIGYEDYTIQLPFESNKFSTIECDFPWRYNDHGLNGFQGSKRWRNHTNYLCAPIEVLRNTCPEITRISKNNAHLYFWTTDAFLMDSLNMLDQAGWELKQDLIWVKTSANGEPKMLPGHYFRRNVEHCLFLIRKDCKNPIQPKQHATLRGTFFWRKPPQHSAKPDEFYQMIVDNSPEDRVSLFQRTQRPGFTCWGNEMPETTKEAF